MKSKEGKEEKLLNKHVPEIVKTFLDADNGNTETMTGWNLYNAIQGYNQHRSRKNATYERSLILGRIANYSESSLNTVNQILFEGDNAKTSTPEFDKVFAEVA